MHIAKRITCRPSAALLAIMSGLCVEAQFWEKFSNPLITIRLTHPPRLGLNLKRVAVAPPYGSCADEIGDGLASRLVNEGMEVLDRQHLQATLAEHRFSLSGYVDSSSAAQLGKLLGPTALVFIKVSRCNAERKRTYRDVRTRGGVVRVQYATVEVHIRGTFQTVDLTTGKIFTASPLIADQSLVHQSEDGFPEFPSEDQVRDGAITAAVQEAASFLVPWTEGRRVYFYDDKECSLNLAYAALKAGDVGQTVERSERNLEACKTAAGRKNNTLAHAYYNAGLGNLLVNQHAKAIAYLEESEKLRGGDIVVKTLSEARRAAELSAAAQQVAERTAQFEQASEARREAVTGGGGAAEKGGGGASRPGSGEPVEKRLEKLDALFKKGFISKEEFEAKKQDLLKEL